MNRVLFFIIAIILLPHIFYAQQRGGDYNAIVEKATRYKKEADILNSCNFIINGKTVKYSDIHIPQIIDVVKENEIIIEFFLCPDSIGDLTYWAFVIKRDMKSPRLYEICKEAELSSLIEENKNFYNNTDVAQLILCPIADELRGVETIYYSPSGKLHEIALEYCLDANGQIVCENYKVFRLTSSAMICNRRNSTKYHHYSVWGGIDIEDIQFECIEDTCLTTYDTRQFSYLQDSFKAAKQIVEELSADKDIVVDFYHDTTTTEYNFKSMSGKDIDAFLIETHGIITSECSISPKSNNAPLNTHALALSGAVSVMDTGICPAGIEDGLITEDEIAQLDFSSMDIAVISACKSALGKFEWDGVHGLMRGFKTAGVNSLVMTLDDVVDYVSGELWIQFFRNLTNGQSKREALLNGIRYIKSMDNAAYSHPSYWTPFILIDGIE